MKQGSHQSAVLFVAFLVVLSGGARLLGPRPAPVVPADAAGLDLEAYRAKAQRAADAEAERTRPLAAGERIAVNLADTAELMRLPGVGASLAARIVDERRNGGGFRTAADLVRVSGIGRRTAERLATHLDFSGAGRAVLRSGQPLVRAANAGGRAPTALVDVNRADAAELERLRGIGPVLARRIVAHRDSAGPFRSVDDLVAVPGIGPATLARIRAAVRVGGG